MKRVALIIEASDVNGVSDLPGARKDIDNWQQFLRSEMAGAWIKEEIAIMHKPRAETVVNFINQHRNNDYCMIIYTGHGAELKHQHKSVPHVLLNENDHLVDIKYLVPKSSKGILISDACRSTIDKNNSGVVATQFGALLTPALCASIGGKRITGRCFQALLDTIKDIENIFMDSPLIDLHVMGNPVEDITTKLLVSPLMTLLGIRKLIRNDAREKYEKKFFEALKSCRNGVTTIFSSSSGEASMDGSAGGAYLTALLCAIKEWKNANDGDIFTTYNAHENAVQILKAYNYAQNPQYSDPIVGFPIAIKNVK